MKKKKQAVVVESVGLFVDLQEQQVPALPVSMKHDQWKQGHVAE